MNSFAFPFSLETMNMSSFPVLAPSVLPPPDEAMDADAEPIPSPIPNPDRHSYQEVVEEFLNISENSSSHVYFEKMKYAYDLLFYNMSTGLGSVKKSGISKICRSAF